MQVLKRSVFGIESILKLTFLFFVVEMKTFKFLLNIDYTVDFNCAPVLATVVQHA